MPKKCAFHVLGCKVNQNEVESLKSIFKEKGYEIVPFNNKADVYIIHTCTVTGISDRKSRQHIRKAARNNPKSIIAVTGCYSQVAPHKVENIPGVNIIVGTNEKRQLLHLVERALKTDEIINTVGNSSNYKEFEDLPLVSPDRARAFLKIQDGCESYCSYCIVPLARGPVRSKEPDIIINEAKSLVEKGYIEIVLTGIHTGFYGRDFSKNIDLSWLIEKLVPIKGLKRLRISSLNPDDIDDRLLQSLTENNIVCPHYHIPLQSGDNYILNKMGRQYTVDDYTALIEKIRKARPEAAVTTDVMVGFPGEKEKHFNNTFKLLEEIAVSDMHVFQYSPRKGTSAYEMKNDVSSFEKKKRSEMLVSLSEKLFLSYAEQFLGRVKEVLVEKNIKDGYWKGHTDNYLPVVFNCSTKSNLVGRIIDVSLLEISESRELMGRGFENNIGR